MDADELGREIVRVFESVSALGDAQRRFDEGIAQEISAVWRDVAALRDELHALANRVERLTQAVTTEPAEVAEAIQRGNLKAEPYRG